MITKSESSRVEAWRTPTALLGATATGAGLGIFLHMIALPFGPILFGWMAVLVGAIIVPPGFCILAKHRCLLVRFSYAVGVAAGAVVMNVITLGGDANIWWVLLQFMIIFVVVGSVSLIAAGCWAVLRWADDKFKK